MSARQGLEMLADTISTLEHRLSWANKLNMHQQNVATAKARLRDLKIENDRKCWSLVAHMVNYAELLAMYTALVSAHRHSNSERKPSSLIGHFVTPV